jgi:sulfoxide reductase catalytic subunit YedY
MLIRRPDLVKSSEITPRSAYLSRRQLIVGAAALGLLPAGAALAEAIPNLRKSDDKVDEALTSQKDVTHYNNFYEFGLDKEDPSANAPGRLKTRPWTIKVDGECAKPGTIDIDAFLKQNAIEERVYRHRCVEAWSMVIPWAGVPLAEVLKRFEPNSNAKYVAFETLGDRSQMPGLSSGEFSWPYHEGLRIDEAMHPLALLAVGLYGETLPAQNGAPIRLVVPWKYGFKGIKSIVRISFVQNQPKTLWNDYAPREYGFYSNVNPAVDHPRWSQAKEHRIGEFGRRPTLPFNGYAEQVASLYSGMDLKTYF